MSFIGKKFLQIIDDLFRRIPILRTIYSAIGQMTESFTNQEGNKKSVVLVEYPRKGIWVIGFVTGETKGEVQTLNKATLINVFIPTTPNPTSGFLLFLPKNDLIYMNMNVQDAVKMVISGGIVTPKINKI